MFESLKKKFSKTSKKLTKELEEEAKQEDNYVEESPKKSFFSFGKSKDKEEDKLEKDEKSSVKKEKDDKKIADFFSFYTQSKDDDQESSKKDESKDEELEISSNKDDVKEESKNDKKSDDVDESKDEKKSWLSFGKSKGKEDGEEAEEDVDESKDEKKSRFSFGKSKGKEDGEEAEGEEKKSRSFFGKPSKIFSFINEKTISEKHVEDILWELEMGLLEGDVAIDVASKVVESVKNDLVGQKIKRSSDIEELTFMALRDAVREIIDIPSKSVTEMIEEKKADGEPFVIMFVGINGTGKTTTIGKLANYYLKKGYDPVIAASDTFRAGAIEQVTYHADNVGVKIIKHQKGSDPAAVAFDAVEHAQSKGKELVLIDTAGRMQTNVNLMDEMKKIKEVSVPDLVIFVGDALTGNDATEQAAKFNDAIDIDGVILTKADADSKGGASLSIGYVIKRPIFFLGMGQGYDDIMEYDANWMLDQLFSFDDEEEVEVND